MKVLLMLSKCVYVVNRLGGVALPCQQKKPIKAKPRMQKYFLNTLV